MRLPTCVLLVFSRQSSSSFYREVVTQVISRIRSFILTEIRSHRNSSSQKVVTVEKNSAITSIFGISGANTVQFDTPSYQYQYEHRKK